MAFCGTVLARVSCRLMSLCNCATLLHPVPSMTEGNSGNKQTVASPCARNNSGAIMAIDGQLLRPVPATRLCCSRTALRTFRTCSERSDRFEQYSVPNVLNSSTWYQVQGTRYKVPGSRYTVPAKYTAHAPSTYYLVPVTMFKKFRFTFWSRF